MTPPWVSTTASLGLPGIAAKPSMRSKFASGSVRASS